MEKCPKNYFEVQYVPVRSPIGLGRRYDQVWTLFFGGQKTISRRNYDGRLHGIHPTSPCNHLIACGWEPSYRGLGTVGCLRRCSDGSDSFRTPATQSLCHQGSKCGPTALGCFTVLPVFSRGCFGGSKEDLVGGTLHVASTEVHERHIVPGTVAAVTISMRPSSLGPHERPAGANR